VSCRFGPHTGLPEVMGPATARAHSFGESASALRYLARGGGSFSELGPGLESSNHCTVTEGDLSGGGGQAVPPAHRTTHASAARVMIAERLHQVEHTLAAQHEEVLLLVNQLLVGSAYALEIGPLRFKPDDTSLQFEDRARCSYSPGREHPPVPERPSSVGLPGRHPVPYPATDAPRMVLPGQLVEAEDGPDSCDWRGLNPPKKEHFEVSDVFKRQRRRQQDTDYDTAAEVIKRTSQLELYGDDLLQHTNFSEGFARHLVLHPNSPLRASWDILSMLLVLYDMIMVPFGFFEPEDTFFTIVLEWTTRIFWSFDIPVSLVSGYVTSDGTIELRFPSIVNKYLKSWLLLDIAVVGADWTEVLMGQALAGMDVARVSKFTRVFRIIRMIRLLRLAKVGEIVSLLAERLPSEKLVIFIDIVKLVVIMLGIGHVLACIWYLVGKDMGPLDREDWNWLAKFQFADELLDYRYIMSLRWALSQFAGGMDEVTPVSLSEHIYAGLVYIGAFWSGTVFLSILTSHFTQLYILGNQQSQQLNVMRRYLAQNGISKGLVLRVTRNAQHAMKMRQRATPEAAVGLLEAVSEPLRIELHYEMYFPLLGSHDFFAHYMKYCPFVVRKICHAAMSTSAYSKDDVIFHFGETASRMLIVRSGSLTYSWGAASSEQLGEGRCIAEAPLWTHWSHRGVLTAREDTIVFCVIAELFQAIVSRFEIAVFDPGDYANRFVRSLNSTPTEELTDLPLPKTAARRLRGRSGLMFAARQTPPTTSMMSIDSESDSFADALDVPSSPTAAAPTAAAPTVPDADWEPPVQARHLPRHTKNSSQRSSAGHSSSSSKRKPHVVSTSTVKHQKWLGLPDQRLDMDVWCKEEEV